MQQAVRPLPLPVDLGEMRRFAIVQALALQRCPDARAQQHRVERLLQIVFGAELDAPDHALEFRQGRDHDHGYVAPRRVRLEPLQDLEAVELRHHDVEEHEIERPRLEALERLFAVGRLLEIGVAFPPEPPA